MGEELGWAPATDFPQLMHDQQRQLDQLRRRNRPPRAREIMGPGLAPRAVRLLDWNAAETTFSGIYYSRPGALNGPTTDQSWMGLVRTTPEGDGVTELTELDADHPDRWYRSHTVDVTGARVFGPWKPRDLRWEALPSGPNLIGSARYKVAGGMVVVHVSGFTGVGVGGTGTMVPAGSIPSDRRPDGVGFAMNAAFGTGQVGSLTVAANGAVTLSPITGAMSDLNGSVAYPVPE